MTKLGVLLLWAFRSRRGRYRGYQHVGNSPDLGPVGAMIIVGICFGILIYAIVKYCQENGPTQAQKEAERKAMLAEMQRWERYKADKRAKRQAREAERRKAQEDRRAARDQWYLERGVEPGRLAWYRAMPEWAQAVILGATVALPLASAFGAAFAVWGRR